GRASASSGTSQMLYCGLHTLVVSRKPSTARNANGATRGVTGAFSASQATSNSTAISANATAIPGGGQYAASVGLDPAVSSVRAIAHSELRSAGRCTLNV